VLESSVALAFFTELLTLLGLIWLSHRRWMQSCSRPTVFLWIHICKWNDMHSGKYGCDMVYVGALGG
jgi:hypothetical protein